MSSKKDCHINPLTGRAIKTSGATYKKLMEKEKKATKVQASIKSKKAQSDLNKKKEAVNKLKAVVKRTTTKKPDVAKPKEPNQMYKQPIGPKVEQIPSMLREYKLIGGGSKSNKEVESGYKTITTKRGDGSINMKRVIDPKKSKIVDVYNWRLPMLDFTHKYNNYELTENFKMWLNKIDSHLTLNRKLDDDDIANFNSIYKYVDELVFKLQDRMKNDYTIKEVFETKLFRKYLKLRKKITGEVNNNLNIPADPEVYNKPNIYPSKNIKPDYTKDGYFEDLKDLENYLKSLVNLKPELKELYKKHKLDMALFVEKLNKIDKRIPPTVKLFNSLYGEPMGIDTVVENFKTKPIRKGR